jgi:hypothetical protein
MAHGAYVPWSLIGELLSLIDAQIDLNGGTKNLRPQLDSAMRSCIGSSWRNSAFRPSPEFGAGVLNMSPGWFQRAHDVSLFSLII